MQCLCVLYYVEFMLKTKKRLLCCSNALSQQTSQPTPSLIHSTPVGDPIGAFNLKLPTCDSVIWLPVRGGAAPLDYSEGPKVGFSH